MNITSKKILQFGEQTEGVQVFETPDRYLRLFLQNTSWLISPEGIKVSEGRRAKIHGLTGFLYEYEEDPKFDDSEGMPLEALAELNDFLAKIYWKCRR